KIQQVRDRLTINMVDRVLFDSGRADIKPAGLKVLKQVGDVLNKITDKQIRIEGHTDNVPISTKLQDKFKTNWELSTTRATTVVRFLIDQGGVQPQSLSAVGFADTHPIESNDSEQGVLQPADRDRTVSERFVADRRPIIDALSLRPSRGLPLWRPRGSSAPPGLLRRTAVSWIKLLRERRECAGRTNVKVRMSRIGGVWARRGSAGDWGSAASSSSSRSAISPA